MLALFSLLHCIVLSHTPLECVGVCYGRFTVNFVLFLLSLDSVLGMIPQSAFLPSFYRYFVTVFLFLPSFKTIVFKFGGSRFWETPLISNWVCPEE